jgi:hypothetical protein
MLSGKLRKGGPVARILATLVGVGGIYILGCHASLALTGLELHQSCQEKKSVPCVAYMRGFIDGFTTGNVIGSQTKIRMCLPKDGISAEQVRLIVEKHLREHPQDLHQEAGLLAMAAMMDAFACR